MDQDARRHSATGFGPRWLAQLAAAAMLALGAIASTPLVAGAATVAPNTQCSNGLDNTGGLGLICEVTVVNQISATTGTATVTIRECHGAAGAPTASCTNTTTTLSQPVTAVTQCNSSGNGGGSTVRCSASVTNNFAGVTPSPTAATVNQCVGSGDGITTGCNPYPATTTGAAITQCNGSANGGTLVGLNCLATGTTTSALLVTINQCNGSGNGGGGLVTCSSSIVNNVSAGPSPSPSASASVSPSPVPSPSASARPTATVRPASTTPVPTIPPTSTAGPVDGTPLGPLDFVVAGFVLLAFLSFIVIYPWFQRRQRRSRDVAP